ncbi:hypothetical protein [Polyangium mundeleinium]|uniref:Uncharacterized protein n=1 Tax=Polyangium mundeleinium TaxID=2995306 RepID=A0ABT5EJD4_9BACT|nr:hypothetical protein [Polyangium mundeleinium]MDC0741288.1 hypothetical protein [Polyangium mundeleinium]
MDKVSLTYFVDFVLKSGTPKLTGVREYKERKDELSTDFYRPIREAIVEMHKLGLPASTLAEVARAQDDEKRQKHYPLVIAGYRSFLAEGPMNFFEPPRAGLSLGALEIDVNPELGLVLSGKPHLIKLYFRSEPLTPRRTAVILALLSRGLCEGHPEYVPAVLDVRNGKLHTYANTSSRIDVLLRGEAAAFAAMYGSV